MKTRTLLASLVLAVTFGGTVVFAQSPRIEFPAPSPACTLKQRVGLTDIEIVYSRPSMKGRKIFGEDGVVPYGKVWRTGANNATKITFSTPVKINGTQIAAGTYALYTIPGDGEWTIILNKGVGKSGTQYDEKEDVVRFKATARDLPISLETLVIEFNHIRDESAVLNIAWENTVVSLNLQLDLTSKLLPQIDAAMSGDGDQKPYYQAAMFYYDHGLDLQKARTWIDAAIKQREAHYIVYLKAKILAKLGDKEGAIAAAKRSSELAVKANDTGYVKMNDDLISSLK